MSLTEEWTVGRLLQWTKDYLEQQGSESPRLDAEVLLAHARGCERIALYTAYDQPIDDDARGRFRELVRRRAAGEPVAYLVGQREFYSLPFVVTPDVLIPRPETEQLVLKSLDYLNGLPAERSTLDVLEIGVGSGIVSVCIAKYVSRSRVVAVDISQAALAVATQNVAAQGVQERVTLLESDFFSAAPEGPYDLVVSNPPYVSEPEYAALSATVRDFEPKRALVGGPTGAESLQRLASEAPRYLRPGGCLLVEISPMLESRALDLLQQDETFRDVRVLKDLADQGRVVQALRA